MLHIYVPGIEGWDEKREIFVSTKPCPLALEHSLVSVSKWEARWNRSFFATPPATRAEELDYVRCMTLTQNVPDDTYAALTPANLKAIRAYMDAPMTATKISAKGNQKKGGRTVTSELVYSWMIQLGIPFECQKWHLNRLLTLIRVCEIESRDPKKQSKNDILRQNAALNAKRRKMMNSRG